MGSSIQYSILMQLFNVLPPFVLKIVTPFLPFFWGALLWTPGLILMFSNNVHTSLQCLNLDVPKLVSGSLFKSVSFGTAPKGCHCFPCSLSQQSSLVSSCTFPIIKCKQEFSKELWFILLSSDIYKPRSKTKGIGCNWNVTVAKLFQWLKLRGNMHVF